MTARPWDTEPKELQFEAEGLRCAMRRYEMGYWCGYVGVGRDHPLYGLPRNHLLKLPLSWFEHRRGLQGTGAIDMLLHATSGRRLEDACAIGMAFEVHGGVTFANHRSEDPDLWWFGFDCSHAGDYIPELAKLPGLKGIMRDAVYRDQQYVVGECMSLAAQLVAVVKVLEEQAHGVPDNRSR